MKAGDMLTTINARQKDRQEELKTLKQLGNNERQGYKIIKKQAHFRLHDKCFTFHVIYSFTIIICTSINNYGSLDLTYCNN